DADGAFTDADVIVTEATTLEPFPQLESVINGGTATYLEPEQAWERKDTAPYYNEDYEEEDDGRRQTQHIEYGVVFQSGHAQRLLKAAIEEARRFRTHVVPLPAAFGVYRPLQVLAWTSDENGYTDKLFLITGKT